MLTSKVKQEESETLAVIWDIVGIAYESALRTGRQETLEFAQHMEKQALWWKERIATHDYTEDERRYKRVTELLSTAPRS